MLSARSAELLYGPGVELRNPRSRTGRTAGRRPLGSLRPVASLAIGLSLLVAACGQVSPPPLSGSQSPATSVASAGAARAPDSPAAGTSGAPTSGIAAITIARSGIRLPSARSRAVALSLGPGILVCGGLTSAGTTTGSILGIDLRSGRVSEAGTLATPVHDAGGSVLGGSGFIVGGGAAGPESVVQAVDPSAATRALGQLPAVRADLVAVSVGGELVVVGGGTPARPDPSILATSDGSTFRVVGRLAVGVRYPAIAVLGGSIYVIGGSTPGGDTAVIQAVDPGSGAVRIAGHLPHALSHASALVVGGALLIAGGREAGRAQVAVMRFDPASGVVTTVGRLPYAVSDTAAVVVDGIGYLIGGEALASLASIITITPH